MGVKDFLASGSANIRPEIKSTDRWILTVDRLSAAYCKFVDGFPFVGVRCEDICHMALRDDQCM